MADLSVMLNHICGPECSRAGEDIVWHHDGEEAWSNMERLYSEADAYMDGYHDGYAEAKAEFENRKRLG